MLLDVPRQDLVLLLRPPPLLQPHLLAARRSPHPSVFAGGGRGRESARSELQLQETRLLLACLAGAVDCGVSWMGLKKVGGAWGSAGVRG